MHELSLVNALLEIVDDYARKESFKNVHCLRLSMGRLACVDQQSLQFAFDAQVKGGIAEGAQLDIDVLPAVISCFACGGEARLERFDPVCPECGSAQVKLTGGTEELRLIALDVDSNGICWISFICLISGFIHI